MKVGGSWGAEVPPGWEKRVDQRGIIYFANHKERTTCWAGDPRMWRLTPVSKSLAAWWEQFDKASLTAAGTR